MNSGIFSRHNKHFYSIDNNPRKYFEIRHQHRFSLNVWAEIIGNCFIGSYILPINLTGNQFLQFLQYKLGNHLDEIVLAISSDMFIQLDGAGPHYTVPVGTCLNAIYPD